MKFKSKFIVLLKNGSSRRNLARNTEWVDDILFEIFFCMLFYLMICKKNNLCPFNVICPVLQQ